MSKESVILVIYTGGTIGMVEDSESKSLLPFDFEHLAEQIPEMSKLNCSIETLALENPVDSAEMNPIIWLGLAKMIESEYDRFDGFVILHGSDTMAYTACALSFVLENLDKPVILTGSQLPIGVLRTDGKENFLTAIEIASAKDTDGLPMVPEVCIYFEYKLLRGNRAMKYSAENFRAFVSPNYPKLAQAGVSIRYFKEHIARTNNKPLVVNKVFNDKVFLLPLYPGISKAAVETVLLNPDFSGVIIETFGAGNAPRFDWFLKIIEEAIASGKFLFNVTQCPAGTVNQGLYATSEKLRDVGVISGKDITREAAVTKMMYLLGHSLSREEVNFYLGNPLRGEMDTANYYQSVRESDNY